AALGPLAAGYAAVAALLALITAIASVATFSVGGVLRAAAPGWLAAYQVPITIAGRPLGVLPLLLTAGMCVLVARSAAHAAERLGCREPGQAVGLVAWTTAAHALFGVVIALFCRGTTVVAEPLTAFLVPGAVAAVCATVGIARPCGLVDSARKNLDPMALRGLRAGALGLAGLAAVGTLVFTMSLVFSLPTVAHLFTTTARGFGSGTGMLLLSLGYLPNAIVSALSFAVGPGFSMGSVSVGVFSFTGGVMPAMPLLGMVPEHGARWWPALMVLPAGVGALVGWSLRNSHQKPLGRLRMVVIAGAVVGFGCVLLGAVAGGRLGSGAFNPVSVPAGLMSAIAFGWIVVPGGLMACLAGPRPVKAPRTANESVPAAETDDGESPEPEGDQRPPESPEPEEPS
ncbi:cell division protein PerM, partial [Amycolatopsis pigmentata]